MNRYRYRRFYSVTEILLWLIAGLLVFLALAVFSIVTMRYGL